MKRLRLRKGGRPRIIEPGRPPGERHRSRSAGPTPETLRHRADRVGAENASCPEAGYALGILLLRGNITRCHHDAGLDFLHAHKQWCIMQGLPPRRPVTLSLVRNRSTAANTNIANERSITKTKEKLAGAMEALSRRGVKAFAAVDAVVIDDMMPESVDQLSDLADGLEALARYFKRSNSSKDPILRKNRHATAEMKND